MEADDGAAARRGLVEHTLALLGACTNDTFLRHLPLRCFQRTRLVMDPQLDMDRTSGGGERNCGGSAAVSASIADTVTNAGGGFRCGFVGVGEGRCCCGGDVVVERREGSRRAPTRRQMASSPLRSCGDGLRMKCRSLVAGIRMLSRTSGRPGLCG
jgi:hypothetical protein